MLPEEKKNQIPAVVVNFIDVLNTPHAPKFQKEQCALTLERIQEACSTALTRYYSARAKKTRQ